MYTFSWNNTPFGRVLLASDGTALTGFWFEGQKYFGAGLPPEREEDAHPVFTLARQWLEKYAAGENPPLNVPLAPKGPPFRQAVWQYLRTIPYGTTQTYGEVAAALARECGRYVSPRAVGGAVAHNPISVFIPCHRVVGAGGKLTGYAGGLDRKRFLLRLEGALR